ncbi:hypothetical protein [Paenibacillus pini]|uniref:hypothetical protein n=1 Tax=Paenibacillus pini TaxID=669461 RepID=UPI00055AB313|nr:hypothetical protein [Paenibacillus pini]
MKKTNYHLTITENKQDYYFYHEFLSTGDILRIGSYRVVITHKDYNMSLYTEIQAQLVNEGEIIISKENMR